MDVEVFESEPFRFNNQNVVVFHDKEKKLVFIRIVEGGVTSDEDDVVLLDEQAALEVAKYILNSVNKETDENVHEGGN